MKLSHRREIKAMGIIYVSDDMELEVRSILSFCKKYGIDFDFIDFDDLEGDYDEEIIIDKNTEIRIAFPETEDFQEALTIEELSTMIEDAVNGEILEDYKFISKNSVLISIQCDNPKIHDPKLLQYYIVQKWNGKEYKINLVKELSSFGIKLTIDGLYDDYAPPVSGDDLFIEITSKDEIENESINEIVQAFIFECSSSLDLNLHLFPRATNVQLWDDRDDEDDENNSDPNGYKLRPLLQGKGMADLLYLYNSCNQIYDPEYLILTYTKVIEYVSQTVLRKEMLESIAKRLHSPRTLNPDATYILDLEKLFTEHRNNQKDSHAIKLTVETCCDIIDLVPILPKYLIHSRKLKATNNKPFRDEALSELAIAISDTRNMIAHAKTNYNNKGNECPKDQLMDFSNCLKVVASQTIRWFSRQHEDSRIV
jgi:hypothetical protein